MNINGMTLQPGLMQSLLMSTALAFFLVGCSTNKPQHNPVKEVLVCTEAKCKSISQKYTPEQLLNELQQLTKANTAQNIPICAADAKTNTCTGKKVCYFVLGGLLPGNGCAESLMFNDVEKGKATTQINMKTVMPLSFIGTNVSCDAAVTTLSVKSTNDIAIELEPYHCSWMVMGQMKAKFSFFVDRIDTDSGQISGHWNHSVAGTGNGKGSGYAILKFPKNISW